MKKKTMDVMEIYNDLFLRYPKLDCCKNSIYEAFIKLTECYRADGKLMVAGNGGSAADSEHMVGELLKSFLFLRKPEESMKNNLIHLYGSEGERLAGMLEGAFPAIPLTSMPALSTAYANDIDAKGCFAQMLNGIGRKNDVFMGITTSGNSKNVIYALMAARAKGIATIVLTGDSGGDSEDFADIMICVPERETVKIQELHLPIYHAICAMLEAELFEEK